jgi:hypothetical protein
MLGLHAWICKDRIGPSKLVFGLHLQVTVVNDDWNTFLVVIIKKLCLAIIVWFRRV